MRRLLIATLLIAIISFSGCVSNSHNIEMEELNSEWEEPHNYKSGGQGNNSYAIDYYNENDNIIIYLRGTAPATNYELNIINTTIDKKELIIRTELNQRGRIGGQAITHPRKVIKIKTEQDIKEITHIFNNNEGITVSVD
jgi:hypothetical protein